MQNKDCFFCDHPLERETFRDSVRDHCHITGEYRSAAHHSCNMKYFIPVIVHSLKNYDAHLIMQAIAEIEAKLKCIPQSMEKYVSFSLGKLRFIDSCKFLQASLVALVKSAPPDVFKIRKPFEPDERKQKLLFRKGEYPYEYMDSWERFEETALPPREAFYSKLKWEGISESAGGLGSLRKPW